MKKKKQQMEIKAKKEAELWQEEKRLKQLDRKYEKMFKEVREAEPRSNFINRSIRELRSQNRIHQMKQENMQVADYSDQVRNVIEEVNQSFHPKSKEIEVENIDRDKISPLMYNIVIQTMKQRGMENSSN